MLLLIHKIDELNGNTHLTYSANGDIWGKLTYIKAKFWPNVMN